MDPGRSGLDYPLYRKLAQFVSLSDSDIALIEDLRSSDKHHPADTELVAEGDVLRSGFLLKQGMAARYRVLPDGGRQILAFLIPGDLCGIDGFLVRRMDHSVGTITAVHVSPIARDRMTDVFAYHPRFAAALRWSSLQEEAMLRERIVSLGRRNAHGRVAYLLCEFLWRYQSVGMADDQTFEWPLTQAEVGDALGLTAVRINRVLKDFRQDRLIVMSRGSMRMLDVDELQRRAGFNRDYLQLDGASADVRRHIERLEAESLWPHYGQGGQDEHPAFSSARTAQVPACAGATADDTVGLRHLSPSAPRPSGT